MAPTAPSDGSPEGHTPAQALLDVLGAHASRDALTWLAGRWPDAPFAPGMFFACYAGAGRRLGRAPLAPFEAQRAALAEAGLSATGLRCCDLARIALLLRACELSPDAEHLSILQNAFLRGDNDERIGVLRSLPALPKPGRFVDLAVEACRSHVQDVFEAIACDNSYPAEYFSELAFNQMVIKVLFTGAPFTRVHGVARRNNPELRRMASDFAAERRAAGRPVPDGVQAITQGSAP